MRKKQTSLLDSQKAFSDEAICAGFLFEQRHSPGTRRKAEPDWPALHRELVLKFRRG